MGRLLQKKGNYAAADSLHRKAQSIYQKLYGTTNLDAANTLYERAQAHRAEGDYATAERFYERAAAMQQSVHGPEHPATQQSRKSLIDLYQAWDKTEKADSLRSVLAADSSRP
jgi:tetratricopeptide (TPR) repeat protein